ncbi:shikimate/quinate 5-dehydrogenase [Aspergillus granulosus]|uniref:Shikimate/quinate 5-dehydrogenase n=1 Tax=Aspergillus granulosus TaxID=176169 RepID=A0ABR4HT63_9EURO
MEYLGNEAVYDLLINLSKNETIDLRTVTEKTLEDFSFGGERAYQPAPSAATRPNGQRTLFRPFTSDSAVGAKLVVTPPPRSDGKKEPLHGLIILLDALGHPTGLMAAEEVTGYRTSMNAMIPFCWRRHVERIVIFGAGMQALWHTRLILSLRGDEVKRIAFVNPSKDRVDALIETLSKENELRWRSRCSFDFLSSSAPNYQQQINARLSEADCVFCTTPSQIPLFPAALLTERGTPDRQPFISAVGSWQPDMIELDPVLLHHAITASEGYNPVTGEEKGVVLVDDRDYAIENAGEIIRSKIMAENMVELGLIIALRSGKIRPVSDRQIEETNRFISEGACYFGAHSEEGWPFVIFLAMGDLGRYT